MTRKRLTLLGYDLELSVVTLSPLAWLCHIRRAPDSRPRYTLWPRLYKRLESLFRVASRRIRHARTYLPPVASLCPPSCSFR